MSNIVKINEDVFYIDEFLSKKECVEYISITETQGYEEALINSGGQQVSFPEIRNNERVILDSFEIANDWWKRGETVLPNRLDGEKLLRFNERFRFYRYLPKQRFLIHKDFPYKREGEESKLSFIVYLNEEFDGGETDFRDFKVQPVTGRALVFRHHLLHEGSEVTNGKKYAVRTDVMYSSSV